MTKTAYVFPGQAAQFAGMGKDMYETSPLAKDLFEQANQILGYRITDIMFEGTEEELKQTRVTQPAVFLHSVIKAKMAGDTFQPFAVAGHSLGEFSALVADEFRRLIGLLPEPDLKTLAVWKMEGHSNEEIAERWGCVPRTVERRLRVIRTLWDGEAGS